MGRVGAWVPAALWAAFLFVLSSRPVPGGSLPGHWDKVAHFAAYLVLGFLISHATHSWKRSVLVAIGLGIAYGITDELHQSFVPGRIADVNDLIADAIGVVAGVLVYRIYRLRRSGGESAPGNLQ